MDVKLELTLPEKIIAVQKQFRIAIQNHQLLVSKKLQNRDDIIKNHLEVIQLVIQNMGKTQASLMSKFRNEISAKYDLKPNSHAVTNIMKKLLAFPEAPRNIPIYRKTCANNENECKKIATWKPKLLKSVLKVNNKNVTDSDSNRLGVGNKFNGTSLSPLDVSKIKIVYNKKKDTSSVVFQPPKKLQSVLKSKNMKPPVNDKQEKLERQNSPELVSNNSISDIKDKESTPPHENIIDEIDLTESPPVQNKMDTRYGKKYEAKIMSTTKIKILCDQNPPSKNPPCDIEGKESFTSNFSPAANSIPPRSNKTRHLDQNPLSIDELNQETFLSIFRLVSIEKCEMLKRKRCERKRRSVAGQSSLYSDYFQPQPKRTYTPRKPVVPITSNNAVIVESPVADDDEDEKVVKAEVCILCHEEGELEVCNSCSEMYHHRCIPSPQKGNCPSCMAQNTNIPSIVGANSVQGNVSNLELIKRYSSDVLVSDNNTNEKKPTEAGNEGK